MDSTLISTFGALAGAVIGGASTFFGSWLVQQRQARVQLLAQDLLRRQDLYNEFVEDAARCYIHARQNHEPDISLLVSLYAKVSRMRIVSSPPVIEGADHLLGQIIDVYFEPDLGIAELRAMARDGSLDFIRSFSEACRAEIDRARAQQS